MSRRLSLCLFGLVVLVGAPAARADGPAASQTQVASSVLLTGADAYYFALAAGNHTKLDAMARRDGSMRERHLLGSWAIPLVTQGGDAGGLSPDGKILVLSGTTGGSPSRFLIVNAHPLHPIRRIALKGSFAFDALSPDGSMLYLIQHTSMKDVTHYVVRAYDLRTDRLLRYRIADKTQQNWVMQGYAMTRATGPGGRWVYTLYQNPGGYPFVHALDTVNAVAHCIGLPWTGDQAKLANISLTVGGGGKTLSVHWQSGRPWLAVNTANWNITHVAAAASVKQVLDGNGTGNLNDLLRDGMTYPGAPAKMPISGYASLQTGTVVTVAEAGFVDDGRSSNTDPALRSAAAEVATRVSTQG